MRMATFNILHGRRSTTAASSWTGWRTAVRLDADILALQEVDLRPAPLAHGRSDRGGGGGDGRGRTGSWPRSPARRARPGWRRPAVSTGHRGVRDRAAVPVPRGELAGGAAAPHPDQLPDVLAGPHKVLVVHEEPRAAVVARSRPRSGPMTVANTHLSFVPGWDRLQLRRLTRDLRGVPGPRVLMGDLNMPPPKPRQWVGMRSLGSASTFPADDPSVSSTTSSPTIHTPGRQMPDPGIADLGSSGTRCGRSRV